MLVDQVEARLPQATAAAYHRCAKNAPRSIAELEATTATYLETFQGRATENEFLDLATAHRVAAGCLGLLGRLRTTSDPSQHRAVQAAVEYFVLEDDAEDDASIVGFDDDLLVLQRTAEALGWDLPNSDA